MMQVMSKIGNGISSNVAWETKRMVKEILNSVEGTEWPPSAEWCVEYRLKTWPLGYDHGHVRYFDTQEEMDEWLDGQREWACLEDNEMTFVILQWDLGPNFVTTGHFY